MPPVIPSRHEGQHIVVTGAGTGIGRAIAQRLLAEGAAVTLLGRRIEPLSESAGGHARSFVVSADVRDAGSVDAAFAQAVAAFGPLRGLVANAGIGGVNEPGDGDRWADLVATNLSGTYHCFRAAQAHLTPGPEPRHLLATASILARIGVPGYTGYCASKAGILGLVRAMAMELAPDGVQVNALCPGWVNTAMARDGVAGMAAAMGTSYDDAYAVAMSAVPLGRMSEPDEIAGHASFLLSTESRGVTGQAIDVNHGAFML